MGLGPVSEVGLAWARELRNDAAKRLRAGTKGQIDDGDRRDVARLAHDIHDLGA
jgi:hypothetical protein